MCAELAQYIAPKRKAVEIGARDEQRITFALNVGRTPSTAQPVEEQTSCSL
jgi:hypothetical protein